jgi:hypothetical protein
MKASRNATGCVYQLTTLAPIAADRSSSLARTLRELPAGEGSPFAAVDGTHFARLVVLDHLGSADPGPRLGLDPSRLMFCADVDGDPDEYLAALCYRTTDLVWRVWGDCVGFPGASDPLAFARWLRSYEIDASLSFATVIGPSLPEIRAGLEARARLASFAVRSQPLEPGQLRKAWLEEFGG